MHWRKKHAAKQAWLYQVSVLRAAKRLPPPPNVPLRRAVIHAHLVVGNVMDMDNAMARCKWAVDWLVRNGYLLNDKPTNLRWGALPTQATVRNRKGVATQHSLTLTIAPDEATESSET